LSNDFFNTNGLPSDKPKEDKFWITQGPSDFVLKENDLTLEIDTQAIYLRNLLAEKIFGSQQRYYDQLPFASSWLSQAGIDSDINISREEFEKLIANADVLTGKFLYY